MLLAVITLVILVSGGVLGSAFLLKTLSMHCCQWLDWEKAGVWGPAITLETSKLAPLFSFFLEGSGFGSQGWELLVSGVCLVGSPVATLVWCLVSCTTTLGIPLFPHSDLLFIRRSQSVCWILRPSLICLCKLVFHDLSNLKVKLVASFWWWMLRCFTSALAWFPVLKELTCSADLSCHVLWLSPQYTIPHRSQVTWYVMFLALQLPGLTWHGVHPGLSQCVPLHGTLVSCPWSAPWPLTFVIAF